MTGICGSFSLSSDLTRLFSGLNVTVMGLGLHGGGTAAALFFIKNGATVTVTDLQSREELASSLQHLSPYPVRYTLGGHKEEDFRNADIVIKNPAIPAASPFLALAERVETDISIFLSLIRSPVIAITGSKGKSTVSSAIHHVLSAVYPDARLGGNITVSPLTFVDELLQNPRQAEVPVVLELSSWQLADLKESRALKPAIAVITNILPDHQNRYPSMESYVQDKKQIYKNQDPCSKTVLNFDDPYHADFAKETPAQPIFFSRGPLPAGLEGGWLSRDIGRVRLGKSESVVFGRELKVPGEHNRLNSLCAGVVLTAFGIAPHMIRQGLETFPGIAHRLEFVAEAGGISYFNDSAATIPHATIEALHSFTSPVHLIMGGTDKEIDFSVFQGPADIPKGIYILEGDAAEKIISVCTAAGVRFKGPFPSLDSAVKAARNEAHPGDIILLSPGCASFGMFKNEFQRGDEFTRIVRSMI